MIKPKILLVEDDESIGMLTKDSMSEHYDVTWCLDGAAALPMALKNSYSLFIFDIMMPKMDGFTLATQLRGANCHVPIIFLTAKNLQEDILTGFAIGADDYVVKPFSIAELLSRIKAVLRRTGIQQKSELISFGNCKLSLNTLLLQTPTTQILLTKKEADLLWFFIQNQSKTISREDLLVRLWGENDYFKGRSMDVFISRLRKYLLSDQSIQVVNVHGVGFRMDVF